MDTKPCTVCGTWTCGQCGTVRKNINLGNAHSCFECGYDQGITQPAQHTRRQWKRHNPDQAWNEPEE